ncbi:MAG: insulinase family protein, partial [Desulfovibrio sp.]|nr:insulinase family protein [Desulfovibrio sp.]
MPLADATVSGPRITKLPNGLTVLVQEDDRFPLVSLRLYVHAGSAFETPEQAGISHLLEHMVFKGT